MGRLHPELAARQACVLVLAPAGEKAVVRLDRLLALPYPLLADPERQVFRAYGLPVRLYVQASGTFLLDAAGVVRYRRSAFNPLGAFKTAELLAAVQAL